jgi:hypothetical protein
VFEPRDLGNPATQIRKVQEESGRDAPAKVSIQQQAPLQRPPGFIIEVEEAFVLVEPVPKPGIRIEQVFLHSQQVWGANGVTARRERFRHEGAEGQEPRQLQWPPRLAQPEAQAGGVP